MRAADVNGTSHRPSGSTLTQTGDRMTLEPAGGLRVVVRVAAGGPVEDRPAEGNVEPLGPRRRLDVGEELVVEGERGLFSPRGSVSA
jgi:hypothetical protein